jgi:hypothetical protein
LPERTQKLLGVGIYSGAEVARLLRLSPSRVSSWVRGYRYAWGPKERRRHGQQPAVVKTDIPTIDGSLSISFLELVELFVVKQFRDKGIPLQTVRVAWNHAAQAFQTSHPFADRRVFTDGGAIFMALRDDELWPDLLEVSSRREPFQIVAGPILRQSFDEIEFDDRTELARRWWPGGRGSRRTRPSDRVWGPCDPRHPCAHGHHRAVRRNTRNRRRCGRVRAAFRSGLGGRGV